MQQKSFDLTTLNGANGFAISGINQNDLLGSSVGAAGDINGDGIGDLVLGAFGTNLYAGESYVIFGSRNGFPSLFNLTNLNGSNGFIISGIVQDGNLGTVTSTDAGSDINGDNIDDLILGASGTNVNTVYVIFGNRSTFSGSFNLNNLNGVNGFSIVKTESGSGFGYSVSSVADINGDGISDLLLSAWSSSSQAGAVHVFFGSRNKFPALFNINALNGTNGFTIPGIPDSLLGCAVSIAGDINADGIADMLLGAYGPQYGVPIGGASYVVFGSSTAFPSLFNLTTLDGNNGFMIKGSGSTLGISVSGAGDINADGIDDLLLGDSNAGSQLGVSYVLFGTRQKFNAVFDLNTLNGTNGFIIPGVFVNGELGRSVSMLGDVSDDGIDDIILGVPGKSSNSTGAAYVIFGSRLGFPVSFNLTLLNDKNGFIVPGLSQNSLGSSVGLAGDINGDGLNDILIGAPNTNSRTGAAYVIFGKFQLVWVHNQLTITQGQTVPITLANINATAINNPTAILSFTLSNIQGGRFEQVFAPNTAITNFTQQQIANGEIQFVSDRSAPVAYNINATDGQSILSTMPANVTFINHPPQVLNTPDTHLLTVGEPFDFRIAANNTFMDVDGDPLTYSATLSDGSTLPSWLHFDPAQSNQLYFNGTAPTLIEGVTVSLSAVDPLNASVSTSFQVVTIPVSSNNTAVSNAIVGTSIAEIVGGVAGGAIALASLMGAGLGFWRYATNKSSRSTEQFADFIRSALNLKAVDNFSSETGQKFVSFVHTLESSLKEAGIDTGSLRPLELSKLADDVADAARNKISPTSDCLGRSVITATDLNDNLQNLVTEVQVLRSTGASLRM